MLSAPAMMLDRQLVIASVIFGVLIFRFPLSGPLAVVWLIALYAVVFGILLIGLGWRLRGINERCEEGATA